MVSGGITVWRAAYYPDPAVSAFSPVAVTDELAELM
jgi:hypothetical protein